MYLLLEIDIIVNSYCFCLACILFFLLLIKTPYSSSGKAPFPQCYFMWLKWDQLFSHCHPKDMTQARLISVFHPPALGNWVKDGCLTNVSAMTVSARTSVEL